MKKTILVSMAALALLAAACCNKGNQNCSAPAAENQQMIIAAKVSVKPDKVSTFIAGTGELIEKSRAEAGCISYTLYQSPADSTKFFFFEEWKDQAAIDAHFAAAHFKSFGALADSCASQPNEIKIYNAAEVKK